MIYALWYYFTDEEKSTNAISRDPEILLKIHNEATKNLESYYHNYKNLIKKVIVEPIQCFLYKDNNLVELSKEDIDKFAQSDNWTFYASYNTINKQIDDNFILEEVLVYLTKKDHESWTKFYNDNKVYYENDKTKVYTYSLYKEPISVNNICLDTYYDEGIMNA
jgi:hypothetical protein